MEDHHKHSFYFFFFFSVFVQLLLIYPGTVVCQINVRYLPGFTGSLPFELETGYINVDKDDDVQLFYYFIKSQRNPREDPLIVWITGGPGCSSLYGLLYQIGPLYFKKVRYNGTLPTLVLNPNSWTKVSNIIFLDAPVWSGFSYSRTSESSHTSDTKSALQTYNFLRKWLIEHPDFLSNPVYIGGDSYSGFIVPLVTLHISNGIEAGDEPIINLKGYLLGNPMTHMSLDGNSRIPFAHGMGLISNEIYESAKKQCGGEYINVDPSNAECTKAIQAFLECVSGLQLYHVLEPNCPRASPKPKEEIVELRRSLIDDSFFAPPKWPGFECRSYVYMFSYYWANDYRVQKALNIRKGTIQEWRTCNRSLSYKMDVESSLTYHQSLSKRGYRSLIYSGDHDLFVPFLGTQAWIKSLNYSIVDDWRPWTLSDQVAGYTRTYANNMTFATLKGAGHTGPEYKPKEGLAMFKRWISHSPL